MTFSIIVSFCSLLKLKYNLPTRLILRASVTLSYKVLGDQDLSEPEVPPIFILHGLLGMKKHWESLGKTMSNTTKRSVVVVDQRNHGDSPHVNSHKYEELASDVLQLFNKLSVEKAFLIGHNMGGRTSMCVSLIAPQRVAGLLIVDISPISIPAQFVEFMPKVLAAMKILQLHPKNVRKARKIAKRQLKELITDDMLMQEVLSNIRVNTKGSIGWACNLDVIIKQFEHLVAFPKEMQGKLYRGPTLFVGGQYSEFIPPDDLTKIRNYFPSSVIHYIPKSGHNVHIEDPRTFLEYCIAFSRNIEKN